ncbi:MAG: TetR/AcrR family transcriptional regulator [Pseudomonadales bacterium]|nr:TetR/AcrR family transcriptional regulator [Pseudomonadales bacterium]
MNMRLEFLQQITSQGDKQFDATEQRILDAALNEAAATGVNKLTMEGIAQGANLNRATIYRRFGNMDNILAALAIREARRLTKILAEATKGIEEPETLLAEGFVAAIGFAREHPVISRTATYEPASLIKAGMANNAALLTLGGKFMADTIRWAQSKNKALHLNADRAGDTAARLFASFVLLPGGINHLKDDRAARKYAKDIFVPMIFGPSAD